MWPHGKTVADIRKPSDMRACSLRGIWIYLFFALQALTACSVKEDRTACPCYTSVQVGEYIEAGFSSAMLSFSSDRLVRRENISLAEHEDVAYVASLERRTHRASLVAGLDRMLIRSDSLLVPLGHDSDPLWLYSEKFYCAEDEYTIQARPHKQYCRLEIELEGLSSEDKTMCSFRVMAEACGLDLYSRSPLEGAFRADAVRGLDGRFSLLLPRQGDGGILLEVSGGAAGAADPFVVDVSSRLKAAGYDWTLEDLKDVSITVDYAKADISIKILDWNPDDIFKDVTI